MPHADRVIYHADMNAYFASVEELFCPELRNVPMAICGDPKSRRGIIVAKNEKAKAFGVKTAETIYQALRKCPNLVLRPARHHEYDAFCEKANAVYGQYTDLLERASIDESYLDVTRSLYLFGGDALRLAHEIRERIYKELGLTISVGVSYNKFFAKMASDMKKPNAVTHLSRENFKEKLWPLPIGEMHMVGKAGEAALRSMGVRTIGDLAQADLDTIVGKLGKYGESLHANANGLDTSPVVPPEQTPAAQSIGKHNTFKRDLTTRADMKVAIQALADMVATSLRREGVKCMAVQLTIKDPAFAVITRQKSLPTATWLAADLATACMELIDTHWKAMKPVRLLAVTAMKLVPKDKVVEQVTLLDSADDIAAREKREKLEQTMDRIREKYGMESILTAGVAFNDIGIHDHHEALEDEEKP
ncbi:MAG: DNA polymerase IV [Firmicutes bacterium]|nr:DNA polymerase IV [Bacillota bacterium]